MRGRKTISIHAILNREHKGATHDKGYTILVKEKYYGIYFSIYPKVELKKTLLNQYHTGSVKLKSQVRTSSEALEKSRAFSLSLY